MKDRFRLTEDISKIALWCCSQHSCSQFLDHETWVFPASEWLWQIRVETVNCAHRFGLPLVSFWSQEGAVTTYLSTTVYWERVLCLLHLWRNSLHLYCESICRHYHLRLWIVSRWEHHFVLYKDSCFRGKKGFANSLPTLFLLESVCWPSGGCSDRRWFKMHLLRW